MNSLFESFRRNNEQCAPNAGGNGFNLQAAIQNLAQQVSASGMTPEQVVRQKIQNGEMTQEQFQKYSAMADQILGRRR